MIFLLLGLVGASLEYENAIMNAASHSQNADNVSLLTIDLQTPYVRMVTLTNEYSYALTDTKLPITTWVSLEPELKHLCRKYVTEYHPSREQLSLWLAQLVGLPPIRQKSISS